MALVYDMYTNKNYQQNDQSLIGSGVQKLTADIAKAYICILIHCEMLIFQIHLFIAICNCYDVVAYILYIF